MHSTVCQNLPCCDTSELLLWHWALLQAIDVCSNDVCSNSWWCTKQLLQQGPRDLQLYHLQNLNGSVGMRLFKRWPSILRLSLSLSVNAQQQQHRFCTKCRTTECSLVSNRRWTLLRRVAISLPCAVASLLSCWYSLKSCMQTRWPAQLSLPAAYALCIPNKIKYDIYCLVFLHLMWLRTHKTHGKHSRQAGPHGKVLWSKASSIDLFTIKDY